jgi:hypothetical protein
MKFSTTLGCLARVLPAFGLVLMYAHPAAVLGQSGFGIITVGGTPEQLPFPCTDSIFCEGVYQSSWVRVNLLEGRILGVDVIYSGNTLIPGHVPIASTPITLSQAIKVHSLQKGLKPPRLGYAKGEMGIYGIADFVNMIVYTTPGTESTSPVKSVAYVSETAPLLLDAKLSELAAAGSDKLILAAEGAPTYNNAVPFDGAQEPSTTVFSNSKSTTLRASSHRDAVDGLQERVDVVVGSGRMLLALIDQVSTWYTVDKDHPTALQKSEELRTMYPKFISASNDLSDYLSTNESWFTGHDLDIVPVDLPREVGSKMRQLKAMGFSL